LTVPEFVAAGFDFSAPVANFGFAVASHFCSSRRSRFSLRAEAYFDFAAGFTNPTSVLLQIFAVGSDFSLGLSSPWLDSRAPGSSCLNRGFPL
jgi:hypothetical protein